MARKLDYKDILILMVVAWLEEISEEDWYLDLKEMERNWEEYMSGMF